MIIPAQVKWPKGKHPDKFRKKVKQNIDGILHGRMLAIDPASGASSMPGWAMFNHGVLESSGTIPLSKKKPIEQRLGELLTILDRGFNNPPPAILVVEEIRGHRAHHYLQWAVGVTAAGCSESLLLECPISIWKAVIPKDYEKSDETDAQYIGLAVVLIAREEEE